MLPALAARAVENVHQAGDLVLDPMCGIGVPVAFDVP